MHGLANEDGGGVLACSLRVIDLRTAACGSQNESNRNRADSHLLPNVKDEPRRWLARLVRKHEA